jgi:hypothetical protein
LGHRILAKGFQLDPTKIKVILNFLTPSSQKKVRGFLGYASYYRRSIEKNSQIARPLIALLIKSFEFLWKNIYQHALNELKTKVSKTPILRGPDWSLSFHISTDASNIAIGFVLGKQEGMDTYTIYYVNKNLTRITKLYDNIK